MTTLQSIVQGNREQRLGVSKVFPWNGSCTKQGISISQCKYVLNLLREIGMITSQPVANPMDPSNKMMPQTDELVADKRTIPTHSG